MGRCRATRNSRPCSLRESDGHRPVKTMLGLYVARALAESSGGRVKLTLPDGDRIRLTAEVPCREDRSQATRLLI